MPEKKKQGPTLPFFWRSSLGFLVSYALLVVFFALLTTFTVPLMLDELFGKKAVPTGVTSFLCLILSAALANIALWPCRNMFGNKPLLPALEDEPLPEERTDRVWIQRADYSLAPPITDETAEGAYKAFKAFDWGQEIVEQQLLKDAGKDACPSGLGFGGPEDPHFVHIMPANATEAMVLYMRRNPNAKKRKDRHVQFYTEKYPLRDIRPLIDAYFENDGAKLENLLMPYLQKKERRS